MVDFRLLGPIELLVGGQTIDLGQPRQRAVLAALLADAGQVVTWDVLIDRVWGEASPGNPRASLRVHVARIRRTLEQACDDRSAHVVHRSGGYCLQTSRENVDLHRFRRLVQAATTAEGVARAALLREAVGLWRGTPLGGLDGLWAAQLRRNWTLERLDALVAWADAELGVGNAAHIVGPLAELAVEHPLAESVTAVLMRSLHAVGRSADALDHYDQLRKRLSEELGIDPAAGLQELFHAILRGGPVSAPTAVVSGRSGPAQLPADLSSFVGRTEHLARFDTLLPRGGPTVVAVITGSPAVGKTTLAIHWAHRVADQFPDGQLYLNLRGFSPDNRAMAPAEGVRRLLDALGVPSRQIPADAEAQTGLFRSLLAGKRVLVLLDNARDAAQVRPLLPGAPGCLVIVTSRDQLTSLVAAEGAHPFLLDVLSTSEARQLLTARLGPARTAADAAAVDDIVNRCARLPLALAVVAARAATSHRSLRTIAADLRHSEGALDALHGGDAVTDVRGVFSWSYRTLTPATGRLFRLLGTHPGPDTSAPATASLAGASLAEVRPMLAELTRAHLLVEHVAGRYMFHDLLRAYAADLAQATDDDQQRDEARRRLLDHYLHTAYVAAREVDDTREPLSLDPPAPGVTAEQLPAHGAALDWLGTERAVLMGAVDLALAGGLDRHAWQLAWTLYDFLDRQGHWHDQVTVQEAAVVATRRLADLPARARAHRNLANGHTRMQRFDRALVELEHALAISTRTGDVVAQAHTRMNLMYLLVTSDRHDEALTHTRHALALYETAGHRLGMAEAMSKLGWCHVLLGDDRAGLRSCEQVLPVFQELGDTYGVANTLSTLGIAHQHLGALVRAVECYERSCALFRDLGDRYEEATNLLNLGDTHHIAGAAGAAHEVWRRALVILADLDHPDADRVRAKLHGASSPEG